MKKALIATNELVENFDGTRGYRVVEVSSAPFEVNPVLFWDDCDDACIADIWYFDTAVGECIVKPVKPEPPIPPILDADKILY